jgi:hypothetical protein
MNDKELSLKLPLLPQTEWCEACGQPFVCEISLGKGCWCADVKLSENTWQELRTKYRNCLCRTCLEKAEAKNAKREEQVKLL